ncbi:hypothetical protein [Arsenicicoccus bolidensis]|uniref:hypothetical protein n=1 Tax=Arsenicicoccus bolidensis TaxID=229480 RepID=UPI0012EBA450|nr:hypothetical protein [Arsenicicoccus bolidensis]
MLALYPLFVVVVVLAGACLVAALVLSLGGRPVVVDDHLGRLLRAQALVRRSRLLAVLLGLLAVVGLAATGRGRLIATAPVAGVVVGLLTLVLGQLSIGRMATGPAAGLEHRRVRDYVPRGQAVVSGILALALLAAVIIGLRLQGADGRQLTYACTTPEGWAASGGSSPWFGSFYLAPALLVWLVGLAATAWGLRLVAGRPRDGSDADLVRADDALRRWSSGALVAGAGLASGALAVPALLIAWMRLAHAGDGMCATNPFGASGTVVGAVAAVVGVLTLWSLVRVLAPHRDSLVARPATEVSA